MWGNYDSWKLATPPEYDELPPSVTEPHYPPIHETEPYDDEAPPSTHKFIELDDRNDPPILE